MNHKTIWILIIVVLVLGGIWWAKKEPATPVATGPIKVGVIIPLSGELASMGEPIKNAIDLAATEQVVFIYEDDPCDAKKALSAYHKLKLEDVKVFYVACSGSVMALDPLAIENGDLILTAYAGSAEIRKTGTEVIRFIPDALSIGDVMVGYINGLSGKKIGLFYEEQDYAKSLADLLQAQLGTKIVIVERYNAKDTTYRTQIAKLKAAGLDTLILVPTSDKAAELVYKEMATLKFQPELIGEVNLCDYAVKPSDHGLRGVCWRATLDTAGYEQYLADYKAKYGKDSPYPFYDSITYDIAKILDRAEFSRLLVEELKTKILAGVKGQVADYHFDTSGEVEAAPYLKIVNY